MLPYGFDYLQFGTKGNGHAFVGELVGGREWVEDYKGVKTWRGDEPGSTADRTVIWAKSGKKRVGLNCDIRPTTNNNA
jgi:hypothetical protein